MTTDFNYNNKTIDSGGPIKPSGTDQPGDPRTRVDFYSDIKQIPNPYVGMIITVKTDETNQNKMTDYKVLSLKANTLGIANSVIDRVQKYSEYLGVNTGGSSSSGTGGAGLTAEQEERLNKIPEIETSINDINESLNSKANVSDIPTKTSKLTNDSGFLTSIPSEYVTETEMNEAIANISTSGGVDLSGYYTKAEIDAYRPLVKTIADNVWTLTTLSEDNTEIYTNILTHNLGTTDICVSFFDSNLENLYCSYKCIDENNIEITNDEAVAMTVVIFHGGINTSVSSSSTGAETSYTNQTWTFIGDSITAGVGTTKTYVQYLKEKLSLGSVINLGVNGRKLSPTMANDITTASTNTNAVFVFGGTNDFYGNVPLGEYYTTNDSGVRTLNTDTSTYRGALISICKTMYSRFPTAMHVLMTPIHRELYNGGQITDLQPNGNGIYLEEYVNSVKEVGRMMSVHVIDLYAESGLQPNVPENKAQFFGTTDGLHPIASGHEKIADCIINNL